MGPSAWQVTQSFAAHDLVQTPTRALQLADTRRFLEDQFHGMVLQATVQRARIYAPDSSEASREAFRRSLWEQLDLLTSGYRQPVGEAEHVENIRRLATRLTRSHGPALREGRVRIGPAQKALNLMLKYHWCAGWIPEPPHCPLDAIIIGMLPRNLQRNWTDLDSVSDYRELMRAARARAEAERCSLAQWELAAYQSSSPASQRGRLL